MALDAPREFVGKSPTQFWSGPEQAERFLVVKPGFETLELAARRVIRLTPKSGGPPGMLLISGGASPSLPPGTVLPDYWIDKYEVTNRQ